MAAGKINLQANNGAVIGLVVPDGLTSGERQIALGTNLSGITAYHLLQGNLAVSNSTITQGFNTTLYTGNRSTQSITTGIDMSTQWGNTAEERFGGLVWLKGRSLATGHNLLDSTRNNFDEVIYTHSTNAGVPANIIDTTSNGFSLGTVSDVNNNGVTYASWNFQTTHRVTGTTNHGKAYTCHYNPFTGFTIVKYEGSGIAGHEIPHHLGRKLGFYTIKNLSQTSDWWVKYKNESYLYLSNTSAEAADNSTYSGIGDEFSIKTYAVNNLYNDTGEQYIMYGWANSYFDKSNKLIGNYEIGVYQGTGASGNKVLTRGKPAWLMVKRLDSTSDWHIFDNQRDDIVSSINDGVIWANTSGAEATTTNFISLVPNDGFIVNDTTANTNASGGQYLYIVAYDTNANGGGTYYPLASDTANVQVNNALIPIAQGIDSNGAKNTILSKNETFSGVTYTQGKNYPYYDALGNRGVSVHKPRYLESELVRTYAGESPDYYDVAKNKWFSTNSGSELVTNGTFSSGTTTGWSTTTGFAMSVQNGTLKIDRNSTTPTGGVYQNIATTIGKQYRLILDIDYISGGGVTVWIDSGNTLSSYSTVLGKRSIEFTAINSSTKIEFLQHGVATGTINIDNISLFETAITPTAEITNGRNYLNHIVHADNDGGVLYVEELPKIEYKDIIKANEYQGKNACTAWAIIDGQTTPPTIRDSYGISSVIKTTTGKYELIPTEDFNNEFFSVTGTSGISTAEFKHLELQTKNRIKVQIWSGSSYVDASFSVQIFGGRN